MLVFNCYDQSGVSLESHLANFYSIACLTLILLVLTNKRLSGLSNCAIMPSTRASTRLGSKDASPAPSNASSATAGTKRKASTSDQPASKRGKKPGSRQATLEESIADKSTAGDGQSDPVPHAPKDEPVKKEEPKDEPDEREESKDEPPPKISDDAPKEEKSGNDASVITHPPERADAVPSTVLEKGLFYFFARPRVNVEDPSSVADLARSYLVLRPLPVDAALSTDGGDATASATEPRFRVLAVPKKVLPGSPADRFMLFVDKAQASAEDVKTQVLAGSHYETATSGSRHAPAARPVGAGVYVLVHSAATTHFAYVRTIPESGGALQEDVRLQSQGSFVASTKNPTVKGPANAQLPKGADFPEEVMKGFGSRSWLPTGSAHLEYENAQILMIGEKSESLVKNGGDGEEGKKEEEELERLEEEDEKRVQHLQGKSSALASKFIS